MCVADSDRDWKVKTSSKRMVEGQVWNWYWVMTWSFLSLSSIWLMPRIQFSMSGACSSRIGVVRKPEITLWVSSWIYLGLDPEIRVITTL